MSTIKTFFFFCIQILFFLYYGMQDTLKQCGCTFLLFEAVREKKAGGGRTP